MDLLTPRGPGGVAVVAAVTAADRRALLARLETSVGAAVAVRPGEPPRRCRLRLPGDVRDDVLVVDRGERGLEVHMHGSPALLRALAAEVGPLRTPDQAPAMALLQAALSPEQLRLAIEQLGCEFAAFRAALAALSPAQRATELAAALERSRVARAHVAPHRVVLVGRQNAGKSTLLNRLLFRERAVAGAAAGLTRDPIADVTTLSGYPYELVDTAGLGPAQRSVDERAMQRTRELAAGADRILVVDGSRGPDGADRALWRPGTLVAATRAEGPLAPWPADLPCDLRLSCGDPGGAPAVRAQVGEALRQLRALPRAGPVGGPAALSDGDLAALRQLASAAGPAPA